MEGEVGGKEGRRMERECGKGRGRTHSSILLLPICM